MSKLDKPGDSEHKGLRQNDAEGGTVEYEVATLAAGCFWGVEEILREIPGILDTEVGYTGGHLPDPTYRDVTRGDTGHAEAVRLAFDPDKISYEEGPGLFLSAPRPDDKEPSGQRPGPAVPLGYLLSQQRAIRNCGTGEGQCRRWRKVAQPGDNCY